MSLFAYPTPTRISFSRQISSFLSSIVLSLDRLRLNL